MQNEMCLIKVFKVKHELNNVTGSNTVTVCMLGC